MMLPVAPGVAADQYDPGIYDFVNFLVEEVTADLGNFIRKLRSVNPAARVILSVSPVPPAATFENCHIVTATVHTKSVLRVAVDTIVHDHAGASAGMVPQGLDNDPVLCDDELLL